MGIIIQQEDIQRMQGVIEALETKIYVLKSQGRVYR